MGRYRTQIGIVVLAGLFFIPFLGGVHLFDWDEINFAEIAREMVISGDYLRPQMDFTFFTEKPPMFMWFQALSMNIFGIGEFASRFPNALAGVITLLLLYSFGKRINGHRFGLIWVAAYFGSILPHLYFRSGIIDPYFNLFIFLGIYHLILFHWKKDAEKGIDLHRSKWFYLIIAAVFTGMAILVKGPVALLITLITLATYWLYAKLRFYINAYELSIYLLFVLITSGIWFALVTLLYGSKFIIEFTIRQWELFANQDAGHGGFIGYHFVVLLIGCFPASIFMLRSMGKMNFDKPIQKDMRRWMLMLFWVVLILFTIVNTKIVHYSSLAYFPLTYLAAAVIEQLIEKKIINRVWMRIGLLAIAIPFGIAIMALPWLMMDTTMVKGLFSADPFAVANLDAAVQWTGWESLSGAIFIGITVLGVYFIWKEEWKKAIISLFGGGAVFVFITLIFFIGRVEAISQAAAIEFYESKKGCDCYVQPVAYKSYGHFFYSEIPMESNPFHRDIQWLKYGDIDKDVYFVTKITNSEDLGQLTDVKKLYEKNGFVFWERKIRTEDRGPKTEEKNSN
jgi:4-amino-4-deoxy-L-arabinose transferase-like glycosyltransferase